MHRHTDTHERQRVSTNLEAIRNGSRVQCREASFIHALGSGVGRGGGAPEDAGGHSPPCPPHSPVSNGEGSGGRVLISWGSFLSLLFHTALEF